jgi:hypothetical protein
MLTRIVAQLKTGTIKNVVPYGTATMPAPPYVVVKPERDPLKRGVMYRVIGHVAPGAQVALKAYMLTELHGLLHGVTLTTLSGAVNKLKVQEFLPDVISGNDDKTISQERLVLAPGAL